MKRFKWLVPVLVLLLSTLLAGASAAANGSEIFLPLMRTRLPELGPISGPLLVDGEAGRLYAQAEVDGVPRTVVLRAGDGKLLYSFDPAGRLALDRTRQRLVVDRGDDGVAILDAPFGTPTGTLSLPGKAVAEPQLDPDTGYAYIFRDSTIYLIDPAVPSVLDSVPLGASISVCGEEQGAAPITHSYFDLRAETLYLAATTYVCTPYFWDTIFTFTDELAPLASFDVAGRFQAVSFAGNLYGNSVFRGYEPFGLSYWALDATDKWYEETTPGSDAELHGIVVDSARLLLYEALWEIPNLGPPQKMIRVSRTTDRTLLYTVPWERLGLGAAQLAGYDARTEQLYFLEAGVLQILPISVLEPPESNR